MRQRFNLFLAFLRSEWSAPLALLAVCVAAYGLWLPHLGFYWDAWPMNWIAQTMGGEGLARYFSTNRPVWGAFYQITTPLLGGSPLPWQLSALLLRWLTGVAVWLMLRLLWPHNKTVAIATSLLFVIYPGFQQQSIGLLYTHFFIVLNAFLFSLVCTLLALRQPGRFRRWTGGAVFLSLVNLLSMEYFFMLELLRPVLIWLVLGETIPWRKRWLPALRHWLPYLAVFLGVGTWRALFFPYTENNYRMVIVDQFLAQPKLTLYQLAQKALDQFRIVLVEAWEKGLTLPPAEDATLTKWYWPMVGLCGLGLFIWLVIQKKAAPVNKRAWLGWAALVLGSLSLLLAGWPFWLTDVPFTLQFAFDRFTLPFMLGVSLLLGGLAATLPLGRWLFAALLSISTALAVGAQLTAGYAFAQDWSAQRNFFWQFTWRVPGLEAGTLVVANESPSLKYSTDNSLTAPLNWIYTPILKEPPETNRLPFMLVYPTIRLGGASLPELEKGQEIRKDYLVGEFRGSTQQLLAIHFNPPDCLQVLEAVDGNNPLYSGMERQTAVLSKTTWINPDPLKPAQPMPEIFGAEPAHAWCYYYQKAMLARQEKDWPRILSLDAEARRNGLTYISPAELLPFIEAEAHTANWARAQQLSLQVFEEMPISQFSLCHLWKKLEVETPRSNESVTAWNNVQVKLACGK